MRHTIGAGLTAAGIILAVALASPAHAQQASVYQTAFDDATDWELGNYYGVQWAVDDTPIPGNSADNSLNYNNAAGTYATGDFVYGFGNSPTIDLTQATDALVAFACRYQTEDEGTSYDQRHLYVYDADLGEYIASGQFATDGSGNFQCDVMDTWHAHFITLDPAMLGKNLQFHFYFDSIDDFLNDFQGWFIDDFIVVVPDVTPPDTITNLAAGSPTTNSISVTWSSPFDDDTSGVAASFDLRYANSPITEANFSTATQVSGEPSPSTPGTAHQITVPNLTEDTPYFFAVRSTDVAGNISLISNVATATTLAPPPPPPAVEAAAGPGGEKESDDILPCSAGTSAAPTGLLAMAGLLALAAAFRAFFRK